MKLVIAGATGLLGTELVRQSLRTPAISSVVALGRRPVNLPDGEDAAKLKNVIVEDFENYSDQAKKELEGADACVWYERASTPTLSPLGLGGLLTDLSPVGQSQSRYQPLGKRAPKSPRGSARPTP